MYSASFLYPFSSISSSDSSADEPTNREKYFSLVRQIRDYLGDEKIDYPDDLVYCFDSEDFRSESKMQQDGTVSKLIIRHKPFQEFIQMLKRSAKFLATDTGEETEQLTKEQEAALESYLTKNQPWEPTGEVWIQRRYGVRKKEEVVEYTAFIQKISAYTRFLDIEIARLQRERKEKETTQETKAINEHIIDHARWLQRELEELPLEERYRLATPINKFLKRKNVIKRNSFLQIGIAEEQTRLEKLVGENKENKENKGIPELIKGCQTLRKFCETLVKEILSGERSIEDVNVLDKAISDLLKDIKGVHAKIPAFKELITEQSHRLDQLIRSLQVVESNETAETSALKKRIIRDAKLLQNEFLANIPFAKRKRVLPVIDAFFKRQQQASMPCFQFAFAEVEAIFEKLVRQNKSERSTILPLLTKCKELRNKRKRLLCQILPGGIEFESLLAEPVDISDFNKEVATLINNISQQCREIIDLNAERTIQTEERYPSWWSNPLSWVGRRQITETDPDKMKPAEGKDNRLNGYKK